MGSAIHTGSILIKDGTKLPPAVQLETMPGTPGWRVVLDLSGFALDRRIREAGWTFFYMATEVGASVIGSAGSNSVRRAVARLLAKLKPENLNSLEITRTESKRFLGIPYTSVFAHARHIQESTVLLQTTVSTVSS